MKLSSALAEQGREQSRINAELRRQGALPPLPRISDYRAAIRQKCVECMGGTDPVPVTDIRRCTAGPDTQAPCPPWKFRPWQ
jgi:hypothetical protein